MYLMRALLGARVTNKVDFTHDSLRSTRTRIIQYSARESADRGSLRAGNDNGVYRVYQNCRASRLEHESIGSRTGQRIATTSRPEESSFTESRDQNKCHSKIRSASRAFLKRYRGFIEIYTSIYSTNYY